MFPKKDSRRSYTFKFPVQGGYLDVVKYLVELLYNRGHDDSTILNLCLEHLTM